MQSSILALGWGLLHSLWQLTALAALYAASCALPPARSPRFRYTIGVLTLALACAIPVFVVWRHAEAQSLPTAPAGDRAATAGADLGSPAASELSPTLAIGALASRAPSWRERLDDLLPEVVLAWLAGVVLFSVRLARAMRGVSRLRRTAQPAPAGLARSLRRLSSRIGIRRRIAVGASDRIDVPMAFGLVRPMILVPIALITALPLPDLELLLLHELAHLRRRDYLVNLLQCVAETLFFFHPAVWWLSARIREEREHCCDDFVVQLSQDRAGYARTLTDLAAAGSRLWRAAEPPLAAAGTGLARRLRRLLDTEPVQPSRGAAVAGAAMVLTVLLASAALALGPRPQSTQTPPSPTGEPTRPNATTALEASQRSGTDAPGDGLADADVVDFHLVVVEAPAGAADLLGIDWLSSPPGLGPDRPDPAAPAVYVGRLRDPTDLGWRLGAAQRRGLVELQSRPRVATLLGDEALVVTGVQQSGRSPQSLRLRLLPEAWGEALMLHLAAHLDTAADSGADRWDRLADLSLRDGDTVVFVAGPAPGVQDTASETLVFVTPHLQAGRAP